MTGVDTDLATLRNLLAGTPQYQAALARVEAELSRLREQLDGLQRALTAKENQADACLLDAEAAEARCARLQQALEPARVFMEHFVPVEEALINGFDVDAWCALADEALAGPDTPADSPAEARCARLRQALVGTRERTAPDGQPCWCPDWKVDDWRGYSTDDWRDPDLQAALHHECCIAAREALAGPDTPAAHSFERKLMGYVGGDDDTSEWYGTCSCGWRGPLREDVDAPREDWVRAHADLTGGVECDACGSPATRYDLDGQWCDVHDRTSACMDCGELDCPGPRLSANGPDTPADSDRLAEAEALIRRFHEACWNHDGDLPDEIEGAASAALAYLGDVIRLADTPADSQEPREGIVMVYDWQHRYLGCMGIERWQEVLAADSQEDKT